MHVDDRLATVLAVRATGENQVRVQYRQLLDLMGTTPADARSELVDAALLRLAELGRTIPVEERTRAIAEPGLRLRNPWLVAELAHDHPRIASAAIGKARLTDEQWLDLLPVLPGNVRRHLRDRTDLGAHLQQRLAQLGDSYAALPAREPVTRAGAAEVISVPGEQTGEADAVITTGDGIGAIVRRIAAYRRNRDTAVAANDSPQLPLSPEVPSTPVQAFTFACDAGGRISAADPAVAGMVVGLSLTGTADPASGIGERFARRQPINLSPIALEGAPRIAGAWILDASPEFDGAGRFVGYVGKMRRQADAVRVAGPAPEGDRLRQILHELRTPVNAIQGFSELIHQQLVGPVPHTYRAVAAGIAADAAQMLAGFDELERLVKLDAGAMALPEGSCDLGLVIERIRTQLAAYTAPRQSGFQVRPGSEPGWAQIAEPDAERLLWRVLATFASLAAPGEVLAIQTGRREGATTVDLTMPAALANAEDPLDAAPPSAAQPVSGSLFGSGFALRLAMAEAAAAGGGLTFDRGKALLLLPFPGAGRLTEPFGLSNPVPQVSALTAG